MTHNELQLIWGIGILNILPSSGLFPQTLYQKSKCAFENHISESGNKTAGGIVIRYMYQ